MTPSGVARSSVSAARAASVPQGTLVACVRQRGGEGVALQHADERPHQDEGIGACRARQIGVDQVRRIRRELLRVDRG